MKKIALVIFSAFSIGYYAQVGIKTTTPVGLLDINGDLNVNKELRMGGTNTVKVQPEQQEPFFIIILILQ
jgi:hypothetical protein